MAIFQDSGLAQGVQTGLGALGQALSQVASQRAKKSQLETILNPPNQASMSQPNNIGENPEFRKNFLDTILNYENESGEMLEPKQLDFMWNSALQQQQGKDQQAANKERRYTPAQLAHIAQLNPQLASLLQQNELAQQKMEEKRSLAKEERTFKSNQPYMEQIDTLREVVPNKETSLMRIRDALSSGNEKNLRNFLADSLDNEYLRSAPLNELNSAVKEFFIADLQSLPSGTRLNQFLEKNLLGALESGGKSPSSNQKIAEYQQFTIDVGNKQIEIADKIVENYEKAGREPPPGLKRKVDKELKPYIQKRQQELTKTYRDINSGKIASKGAIALKDAKNKIKNLPAGQGNVWVLSPRGEVKRIPKDKAQAAEKAGGKIVR